MGRFYWNRRVDLAWRESSENSLGFKLPATSAAVNALPMSSLNMPADVFILRIAGEYYILFIR